MHNYVTYYSVEICVCKIQLNCTTHREKLVDEMASNSQSSNTADESNFMGVVRRRYEARENSYDHQEDEEDINKKCTHPALILKDSNLDYPTSIPNVIWLPPDKESVTVGRSVLVDYCICSVSISRLHAVFTQPEPDGAWYVCDRSINGVFVNGLKINTNSNYLLCDGDVVRLAAYTAPGVSYKFCVNPGEELQPSRKIPKREGCPMEVKLEKVDSNTQLATQIEVMPLVKQESVEEASDVDKKPNIRMMLDDYKTSHEMKEVDKIQLAELKEREAMLRAQLQAEISKAAEQQTAALKEKERLEMMLSCYREEMKKGQEYLKEKERLEAALSEKEMDCKVLKCSLSRLSSQQKQMNDGESGKETVVKRFSETVEAELQCSICSELFVKATTLNCSHSFCEYCITMWRKTKNDCPFCRKTITSTTCSLVLDSFINKVVETLSEDIKQRRKEVVEERAAVAEKLRNEAATTSGVATTAGRRGRPRRAAQAMAPVTRAQRGRRSTRQQTLREVAPALPPPQIPPPVQIPPPQIPMPRIPSTEMNPIDISSDSTDQSDAYYDSSIMSDYDHYDSSDEEYEPGIDGAYYGGYGVCFNCGSRGHWANGCPF